MYLIRTPDHLIMPPIHEIIGQALQYDAAQILRGPRINAHNATVEFILEHFNAGKSVVLHSINRFRPDIQQFCDYLKSDNCNLYLTPPTGGTTEGLHTDPESVLLFRLFGTKTYRVIRDGKELTFDIDKGYGIFVRDGEKHEAVITGASGVLSFGIFNNVELVPPDPRR